MTNSFRKNISVDTPFFDKLNNLLLHLVEVTHFYGQKIESLNAYISPYKEGVFGTTTFFELGNLFFALNELNYIQYDGSFDITDEKGFSVRVPQNLSVTIAGMKHGGELLNSGIHSNNCFIAMAFHKETDSIYEIIKNALTVNGFIPIRVDKEHIASEQTINDFIIASIKSSRFCIADFTHNRNGVYFEAGYALGRGLKVIYTCKNDHVKDLHFDLKPLQFITYENESELKDALDLKIKSFIL